MQENSNSLKVKTWLIVFIFLSSAGLGYSVVNQFVFDNPNTSLLLIFGSLFVAAIAALQRNKYQNLKEVSIHQSITLINQKNEKRN